MQTWMTSLVLLCSATLSVGAQQVHVVDASGLAEFTSLQAAVDAAVDGDVLLVQTGTYAAPTIVGKGLVICADVGAQVELEGQTQVEGVPAGSVCVLRGLGQFFIAGGLSVELCAGAVWVEDCSLFGFHQISGEHPALDVVDSDAVVLVRCEFRGGFAGGFPFNYGSPGARIDGSRVWAFASTFQGSGGLFNDDLGGHGGHGAQLVDAELFASGCEFRGAEGGGADDDFDFHCRCIVCGVPGIGGSGVLASNSLLRLQDSDAFPGNGGPTLSIKGCADGPDGLPLTLLQGSSASQIGGPARTLLLPPAIREGEPFELFVATATGDQVWLMIDVSVQPVWSGAYTVPLLFRQGPRFLFLGTAASTGALSVGLTAPTLPPAFPEARTLFAQALLVNGSTLLTSEGSSVTLLDAGL